MPRKIIFVIVLAIILSACSPTLTPSPSPEYGGGTPEGQGEGIPATSTPEATATSAPSATPEVATAKSVIENEMKGKAPQVHDASVGNFDFVAGVNGAYRVVNERLGLDQELSIVVDEYGERLIGEDGRTVFLKNREGKWIVAPMFTWEGKRAELGLTFPDSKRAPFVEEDGTERMAVFGELVGFGEPVVETLDGKSHSFPTAEFWVGNDKNGKPIIVRMILGMADDMVINTTIPGVGAPGEGQRLSGGRAISFDELASSRIYIGGTYYFSIRYSKSQGDWFDNFATVEAIRKTGSSDPEWIDKIEESVMGPKYFWNNYQLLRFLSELTDQLDADFVGWSGGIVIPLASN